MVDDTVLGYVSRWGSSYSGHEKPWHPHSYYQIRFDATKHL